MNRLEEEARIGKAGILAVQLSRLNVVVLDELGYLPFARSGGQPTHPLQGETMMPTAKLDHDRRALRTQAISLLNRAPDAFEETRHYGPEQVVDGLDAVLNQITGESFGSIVNGGSRRQRDAAVAGWRIYASDLACRKG